MEQVIVRSTWRQWIKAYLDLCKIRVVMLIVITAWVGMFLSTPHAVPLHTFLAATIGIALAACAAAAVNHVVDQHIDEKMHRTRRRPLVKGMLCPWQACVFAACLAVVAMSVLLYWVNVLTTLLTFMTLMGYAVVYTVCLKHATPQNIVIGGLAGAAPPLLGWVAVTGHVSAPALLLVLIVFLWTPPHFWALAIHRVDDYAKAKVPMLPNTHGIAFTKLNILLYSFLLVTASLLPCVIGMLHAVYFIGAIILGAWFLYDAWRLYVTETNACAFGLFKYSIIYLFALFVLMLADHFVFI